VIRATQWAIIGRLFTQAENGSK